MILTRKVSSARFDAGSSTSGVTPVLRPLALAVGVFSFAGAAANAVFVLLVTQRLGLSEFQFGLITAVTAASSVVTALLVTRLVKRTSHGMSMKVSVTAYACGSLLVGFVTFIPLVIVAQLLGGIADPTWNVVSATVRQRLVDDHIFGRMMTAYLFIAWSLHPVGSMVGGVIAQASGPQWVFVLSGTVVGSLLLWARPLFRRIDEAMRQPTPP